MQFYNHIRINPCNNEHLSWSVLGFKSTVHHILIIDHHQSFDRSMDFISSKNVLVDFMYVNNFAINDYNTCMCTYLPNSLDCINCWIFEKQKVRFSWGHRSWPLLLGVTGGRLWRWCPLAVILYALGPSWQMPPVPLWQGHPSNPSEEQELQEKDRNPIFHVPQRAIETPKCTNCIGCT